MIIRATYAFSGKLDISSPSLVGAVPSPQFYRTLSPGESITIPDEYYKFPNIKNAINSGLLELVSWDNSPESFVVNAEVGINEVEAGISGYSGKSGYSGISGYSAFSGISGESGYSAFSGISGTSGYSSNSGYSGISGASGFSSISGASGVSAYSGVSGASGVSAYSGQQGFSGVSGTSAWSGMSGISAYSGISGVSAFSGFSSASGTSGYSGIVGVSGFSGASSSVSAKTTSYSVLSGDNLKAFTNTGASVEITFTLPSINVGLSYEFIVQNTNGIKIVAAASTTIRLGSLATSTAGNIESFTVGNAVRIIAISSSEWYATTVVGTWTIS